MSSSDPRTEIQVLLGKRQNVNHLLHLVLTLLTAGFWVVVWILVTWSASTHNMMLDAAITRKTRELNAAERS